MNKKFGILGYVSSPYWLIVQWFAPYVEAGGLIYFPL
ncbi:MAG: hypothetical protein ACJATI_000874 [Halioglobus sp.]|jgi:hypothetical protein